VRSVDSKEAGREGSAPKSFIVAMPTLSLANCYFAHKSSVFPVRYAFCDAQSGHSFRPCNMHDIQAFRRESIFGTTWGLRLQMR